MTTPTSLRTSKVFMRRTPAVTLQILIFHARTFPLVNLVYDHEVKMENEVKTEEVPVDAGSLPPTVPDVGSQSCKDEPLDSKEDALPSAQVFLQLVPSLSHVSTLDSWASSLPPGQALDFRTDSPPLPPTEPLHQGNSDFRTLHSRLRHNCLMDPLFLPVLAPLLTSLRRLPLPHAASPRLSLVCKLLFLRLTF